MKYLCSRWKSCTLNCHHKEPHELIYDGEYDCTLKVLCSDQIRDREVYCKKVKEQKPLEEKE
jgi:hypothetical protein